MRQIVFLGMALFPVLGFSQPALVSSHTKPQEVPITFKLVEANVKGNFVFRIIAIDPKYNTESNMKKLAFIFQNADRGMIISTIQVYDNVNAAKSEHKVMNSILDDGKKSKAMKRLEVEQGRHFRGTISWKDGLTNGFINYFPNGIDNTSSYEIALP